MEFKANHFTCFSDFQEGVLLLIDKPLGWTSFDVVNKVRGILRHRLGVKKLKVGHAGTLDPLASGLLVICTGRMTKQIQYLIEDDKGYTGTLVLGATTPSYDLETEVNAQFDTGHIEASELASVAKRFTPSYEQQAPSFSAKKIAGKPAYLSARKGEMIELPSREVRIHAFELTEIALPEVQFDVLCSKGTYIRSLVHDFGQALNSGAHLTALRRYLSGQYHVRDALTMVELEARLDALPTENQAGQH